MLSFRVCRDNHNYGIATLEIEILDRNASHPLCSFHWQANTEQDRPRVWYAFRFSLERRHLEGLKESAALVRRIMRGCGNEPDPDVVIRKMERLGFPQVVYDSREKDLVAVSEVKPSEYRLCLDVTPGETHCHVSCLARNNREAKKLLCLRFAEGNYDALLVRWIEGGKQIRWADSKPPDTTGWEEILAR